MPTGQVNLIWYTIGKRALRLKPCLHVRRARRIYACMRTFAASIPPQQTSRAPERGSVCRAALLVHSFELCDERRTCSGDSSPWTIMPAARFTPPRATRCLLRWQFQFRHPANSQVKHAAIWRNTHSALKVLEWKDYSSRFFFFFFSPLPFLIRRISWAWVMWSEFHGMRIIQVRRKQ